jgi:hypothetical protein
MAIFLKGITLTYVRSEVLVVVKMSVFVFWAVMLCGLVDRQNISEEHTAFILALKIEGNMFLKMLVSAYKATQHYNPEDLH